MNESATNQRMMLPTSCVDPGEKRIVTMTVPAMMVEIETTSRYRRRLVNLGNPGSDRLS